MEISTIYCSKCGKPNETTFKFCTDCGKELIVNVKPEKETTIEKALPEIPPEVTINVKGILSNNYDWYVIGASIAIFIGFFMPWIDFKIISHSGYDVAKMTEIGEWIYLLYLIPIGAIIIIISTITNKKNYKLIAEIILVIILILVVYKTFQIPAKDKILYLGYGLFLSLISGIVFIYDVYKEIGKGQVFTPEEKKEIEKGKEAVSNVIGTILIIVFLILMIYALFSTFFK